MGGDKAKYDELSSDAACLISEKSSDERPGVGPTTTELSLELLDSGGGRGKMLPVKFLSPSASTTPLELFSGRNAFGNFIRSLASE